MVEAADRLASPENLTARARPVVWPEAVAQRIAARAVHLRALFGAEADAEARVDRQGRILAATPSFLALAGLPCVLPHQPDPRFAPPFARPAEEHSVAPSGAVAVSAGADLRAITLDQDGQVRRVLLAFEPVDEPGGDTACLAIDLTAAAERAHGLRADAARLARETERRELLLRVTRALLESEADGAGLGTLVFDHVRDHLGADFCFLYEHDIEAGDLRLRAAPGIFPAQHAGFARVGFCQAYCGMAAATRTPCAADAAQIAADARGKAIRSLGGTAYACHPLLDTAGGLLGALAFGSRTRPRFEPEDLGLMQTLAQVLALAWQRRRSAAATRETSARLSLVLDAVPVGVALVEAAEGRIVLANAPMRRDFNPPSDDAAAARREKPWLRRVATGEPLVCSESPVTRALAGGTPVQGEFLCDNGTAAPRRVAIAATPIRNQAGESTGALLVCQDVDEARSAERALRGSQARLQAALDAGGAGTFHWNILTNALDWDDALDRLFGLKPGETARSLDQFLAMVHPEDREGVIERCARCAAEGADFDMEFRVLWPDGTQHWLYDRGRTLRDALGRPATMTGACVDITGRKAAEARLARSEARFRAAVQAVSGIMWTNNAHGQMAGEQPGWTSLTGQSFDEYQGFGWSKAVHPQDAQPTIKAWQDAVAARKTFVFEHRVLRHDGVWRRFAVRAIPVLRGDDFIAEWVGVHTDITEQREAEAVLARSRDELEALVAARTRDLQETEARLAHAQRMEALGQLAGGIAHDFNNVLQAVGGGAAMIARRRAEPDAVERYARMLEEAASRGASITRRLLAFSRRGDLRQEAVDAGSLLAGIAEVLRHTMGAGIAVRLDVPSSQPPLLADKGQLETVLVNLAANARDAMGGKGVIALSARQIVLHEDRAHAHFSLIPSGAYIRIAVSDTGAGMPLDILSRATEPFFTTKGVGKGTGLGLAMARGFAEQSGGGIAIDSAPGAGATVSLWFPLAHFAEASRPAPFLQEHGENAARILLVDDERIVGETLSDHLRDAGFAVEHALSAEAALAAFDAHDGFDAVITDFSMPGMDGLELIRALHGKKASLPAILLTGFVTAAVESAAALGGVSVFTLLRKPVTGESLVGAARSLLRAGA